MFISLYFTPYLFNKKDSHNPFADFNGSPLLIALTHSITSIGYSSQTNKSLQNILSNGNLTVRYMVPTMTSALTVLWGRHGRYVDLIDGFPVQMRYCTTTTRRLAVHTSLQRYPEQTSSPALSNRSSCIFLLKFRLLCIM